MSSNSKFEDIQCPQCNARIPIGKALEQQLTEVAERDVNDRLRVKEEALKAEKQEFERLKISMESRIAESVEQGMKKEKHDIEQRAERKAKEDAAAELKHYQEQAQEKDKKIAELTGQEFRLRKEREQLEEEKRSSALNIQRQLDEEREKVRTQALKDAADEHRLKDEEKDRKFRDILRINEDLKRKIEQGSQQAQGEAQELNLEEKLPIAFPHDVIEPVPKGVKGADILMKVFDVARGETCGIIAIESKRTKTWSDGWIDKLKEDQRDVQAEFGVIITTTLPNGVQNFDRKSGVWISNEESSIGLLTVLREQLIQVARIKASAVGKSEKMEILYRYLTGTQFKQRVEAIVESYTQMQTQLNKERSVYAKLWASREKQVQTIMLNMAGMYGDFHVMVGSSLQAIPLLEMETDIEEDCSQTKERIGSTETAPEELSF